ncbi:unnamed protein product [Caenorhabditis sp. 36 PRJEB53466]|nr:unnamed protein product [Caenorhabditis sp. 36 PRJEB53466]
MVEQRVDAALQAALAENGDLEDEDIVNIRAGVFDAYGMPRYRPRTPLRVFIDNAVEEHLMPGVRMQAPRANAVQVMDRYEPISPYQSDNDDDDDDEEPVRPPRAPGRPPLDQHDLEEFAQELIDPHYGIRRRMRLRLEAMFLDQFRGYQRLEHFYDSFDPEVNNNNGQYRNYNGYLSPSPSPSTSPAESEFDEVEFDDIDPLDEADNDDEDIDLLSLQMMGVQAIAPRRRKRTNSDGHEVVKKKRVTFKDESSEEVLDGPESDSSDSNDDKEGSSRKAFDDDDDDFVRDGASSTSQLCA